MTFAHATLNGLVLEFIRARYGGQPNAPKRLAQDTDSTPRAAENWLAGLNAPTGERLMGLLAAHPDLEARLVEAIAARRQLRVDSAAAAWRARQRLAARP